VEASKQCEIARSNQELLEPGEIDEILEMEVTKEAMLIASRHQAIKHKKRGAAYLE